MHVLYASLNTTPKPKQQLIPVASKTAIDPSKRNILGINR
jgi:hypothetical protein